MNESDGGTPAGVQRPQRVRYSAAVMAAAGALGAVGAWAAARDPATVAEAARDMLVPMTVLVCVALGMAAFLLATSGMEYAGRPGGRAERAAWAAMWWTAGLAVPADIAASIYAGDYGFGTGWLAVAGAVVVGTNMAALCLPLVMCRAVIARAADTAREHQGPAG